MFVMDHVSPPGTSPGGLPRPSPPDPGDDRELGGVADPAIPVHEGYNEMIREMGEEPLLFGGIEAPHVEPPPSIEESALVDSARALGLPLENILLPNSPSEETSRRMAALYSGAKYILSDELFDFEQVRVSQMGFIFHLVEGAGRWRSHEKLLYRLHDAGGWKEERTLPASSLRAAAEYMVQLQGIFASLHAAGDVFEKELCFRPSPDILDFVRATILNNSPKAIAMLARDAQRMTKQTTDGRVFHSDWRLAVMHCVREIRKKFFATTSNFKPPKGSFLWWFTRSLRGRAP